MKTSRRKWLSRSGRSLLMQAGLTAGAILWAANGVPPARSDVDTITQSLNAQFNAVGKVSAPSSLNLIPTGTVFSPYAGSLTLRYRVRSTPTGAVSTLTVQATGDFSPSGGPIISSGPLTYSCAGATLGTPCGGVQTASTTAQTSVTTIPPAACTGGGGPCSAADPNTVDLNFSLENDPVYNTGSYSAVLTFTISII